MTRAEARELQPNPTLWYWLQIFLAAMSAFIVFPVGHNSTPRWLGAVAALLCVLFLAQSLERLAFPISAAARAASLSSRAKSFLRAASVGSALAALVFFVLSIAIDRHHHSGFSQLGWMLFFMNYFFADLRGESIYHRAEVLSRKPASIVPETAVALHSESWGNH